MKEKNVRDRMLVIGKENTAIMKAIAFFMVIVAHYYRFYSSESRFSALSSIGYFGAAIFAFLSGYGVVKSYNANGFRNGWIKKKFVKIYIPFLIINIMSVIFVYGIREKSQNIIERIILGTDDNVMWYIPFILFFNIIFFLIYNINMSKINKLVMFGMICVIQIITFEWLNIGSQWYTATGSLFLGVFVAEFPVSINRNSKHIISFIISLGIFAVCGIGSKIYVDNSVLKDWFTCISGMAFCFVMLLIFENIETLGLIKHLYFLKLIGNASLWGYILHMKMLYLLCRYDINVNIIIYIASACVVMLICDWLWKKITFVTK